MHAKHTLQIANTRKEQYCLNHSGSFKTKTNHIKIIMENKEKNIAYNNHFQNCNLCMDVKTAVFTLSNQ